ncbi:MAG: P1 family peptidase [Spirochaetaceae bacterium]
MKNSLVDVPGIRVGHCTNAEAGTGCTVVLCGKGVTGGVDVRGGAPGSREIPCLDPVNFVETVHAVYLGGGSAYGLDGASGVMQYLEEQETGLDVGVGLVPIVPGAVLFDLPLGSSKVRPDKDMGYKACLNARGDFIEEGSVGAGTGATVGKAAGMEYAMKGGVGSASFISGDLIVSALAAVNCLGDVIDPDTGGKIAGMLDKDGKSLSSTMDYLTSAPDSKAKAFSGNTTLGVVATNAKLSKSGATKVAQMAHDGYARAINPIHTLFDGDTVFCLATGEVESDLTTLGSIAAMVMAKAIAGGARAAESLFEIPAYRDIVKKQEETL